MNYSAQGSITIKRLRNGDSLFMSLELNGKPLYQSYDDQTDTVSPDWTVAANQPIITPHVSSTKSGAVTTSLHTWTYNGVQLVFNGASSGGYTEDSTGKFALNPVNGALKIIANLASSINTANDTLQYACVATVAGVEYNLSKIEALCPGADCRLYPGLNHLFQHCKTGLGTEYAKIEETMSEEVIRDITEWIKKL